MLAAILLKSGLDILDVGYLRRIPRLPTSSVVVMVRAWLLAVITC